MISPLRRLWTWILGKLGWQPPSRALPLSPTPYTPLTLDQLRSRFSLEATGASDGQAGIPSSDATEPTATEQALIRQIESEANELHTELLAKHASYLAKIKSIDFNAARSSYLNIPSDLEAYYRSFAQKEEAYLHQLVEDVRGANNELESFRRRNRLNRLARYPDSHLLHWGVLIFLMVVEAGANSYFFSKGNERGLLGGFVQAIVFAGLNVVLGFILGRAILPNCWSGNLGRKLLGVLGSIAFLTIVVAYSLGVAHFRDSLALAPDANAAGRMMVQSVLESPLQLRDFDSWLLFLLGVLANLFATFDAFRMDDPCPGFGRLDRRAREHKKNYVEEFDRILSQIEERRSRALSDLENALLTLRDYRQRIWPPTEAFSAARLRTQGSIEHLEDLAANALNLYRTANKSARTTPAPAYFSSTFALPTALRQLPELQFSLADVETAADAALSAHDNYRERINSAAAETSDRFRSLRNLTNNSQQEDDDVTTEPPPR